MITFPGRAVVVAAHLAIQTMQGGVPTGPTPSIPAPQAAMAEAAGPMAFWQQQPRFGANCMKDSPPSLAYLKVAREKGIRWIRLAWDKWKPSGRDFLMGDAGRYEGLVPAEVEVLNATLDRAQAADLKVVVPLPLPGMRWRQNNGDTFDGRIWRAIPSGNPTTASTTNWVRGGCPKPTGRLRLKAGTIP